MVSTQEPGGRCREFFRRVTLNPGKEPSRHLRTRGKDSPFPCCSLPTRWPLPISSPCQVNLTREEKVTDSVTSSSLSHFKRTCVGNRESRRVPSAK